MTNTRNPIATFIARFTPEIAAQFRKARAEVRAHFPRGFELVYDNYNAFGCGYSTTARSSGVIVSVVAYPRWVTLFLFHGVTLHDPQEVLRGSGSRMRSIRLEPPTNLRSRAIRTLLKQAVAQFSDDLAAAPPISTHIRSVAAKQLPRRPAKNTLRTRVAVKRSK